VKKLSPPAFTLPILSQNEDWFSVTGILSSFLSDRMPEILQITEPHVHEFMQANMWFVRGEKRDLLIDAGNGIGSLAAFLAPLRPRDLLVVATHAHADHVGSLHEFPVVWAHSSISDALETADPDATLAEPQYCIESMAGLRIGPERLHVPLANAAPHGFDPRMFGPHPVAIARRLQSGDRFDLGSHCFEVLHVPGHSPGCIALYDKANRLLIAGDAIYDGPLVDNLHHSDQRVYRASLEKLLSLEVDLVLAGHGAPFGGARLKVLLETKLSTG
jgi:glyoxylase-like metal-dependent hydrolase (beta-lactamase superfamily II)